MLPALESVGVGDGERSEGSFPDVHGGALDELLAIEQFNSRLEAQVLVADWREEYSDYRPHAALGMLTPIDSTAWRMDTHKNSHGGWTGERGPSTSTSTKSGRSTSISRISCAPNRS